MDMPEPSAEHGRLRSLIGRFTGPELVYRLPYTKAGVATGSWAIRSACDGFFLILDYLQEVDGHPTMRGHGVIGYDARAGIYTLHWFDSFGRPPSLPGRGRWTGSTLVFEHGADGSESRTLIGVDAGNLVFRAETDAGHGAYEPLLEGSYERREAARAEAHP